MMDVILGLLKMLLKGILLLIGGLLLFGGGMCALIGVGSIGSGGPALLSMVGIAVVIALTGWAITQAARAIGQPDPISPPHPLGQPATASWLWLALIAVAILVAVALSVLQATLTRNEAQRRAAQRQAMPPAQPVKVPAVPTMAQVTKNESYPGNKPNQEACRFPEGTLQPSFLIYAAGAYSGKKKTFQIDDSGHQATQMDVTVNQTNKPVVLMLGAYEPTIWNIRWTPHTRIMAVLIGGYHRQVITGISKATPVLISSNENKGPCGHFYVSSKEDYRINPLSRRVFGRDVDSVYLASNGELTVGEPLPAGASVLSSSGLPPVDSPLANIRLNDYK